MLPIVEEILRTKQVRTVDGAATLPLKDSIDEPIGLLLQKLIAEKRPSVTMEIGLAYGLSTLFICEALASVGGKRHIAIDAFQSSIWGGIGLHHVRTAGYGNLLELREELSQDALPRLVAEGVKVDLAYIDGTHMVETDTAPDGALKGVNGDVAQAANAGQRFANKQGGEAVGQANFHGDRRALFGDEFLQQ